MTTLGRANRQRVRVNKRVWTPSTFNVLTYTIFSVVYTRTYTPAPPDINDPYPTYSSIPDGFYFAPQIAPPLVPLTAEASMNSLYTVTSGSMPSGSVTTLAPIANPTTVVNPLSNAAFWQHGERQLAVGTVSTNISPTSFVVQNLLVVADAANTGSIWIQRIQGASAGIGLRLPPGAAKGWGELSSSKLLDLSTFVVIGTNVNDKVNLSYEY
jgi:hypothetical protein